MSSKQSGKSSQSKSSKQFNNNIKSNNSGKKVGVRSTSYDQPASYRMIPVFIILCILPFVVRLKEYYSHLSQYQWYWTQDENSDLFLFYKHWIFVIISVVMAVVLINKFVKEGKSSNIPKLFIPLGCYAILALISAIFSKSPLFSFAGSMEQFESIFALLGYCTVALYTYYYIQAEKDYQFLFNALTVVALIFSVMGIFQLFNLDLLTSSIGKQLILPARYLGTDLEMNVGKGMVFLTLFNPNYVGVYASLIVPILTIMLFFQKSWIWRILNGIASIGLIICAAGAKSLAGVIGLGVAFILIALLMWRYLIKRYYITIPVILAIIIGAVIINIGMHNYFGNKLLTLIQNTNTNYDITQMNTNDDSVSLTFRGNYMKLQYVKNEDNTVSFIPTDSDNNIIACSYDATTGVYQITDSRFNGLTLGIGDEKGQIFYINLSYHYWYFTNQTGDGKYYYMNACGKPDKIINAPSIFFKGHEGIASYRGYIWSRTFPLLKNNIIIGSGPDTFVLDFPQQDYLYRNYTGFDKAIMTKPHSLYLQIAVQTGLLSLIAFLIFYGMYFVTGIRLYIHGRFESYYAKAGLAVFVATFAYMVTGITNDSSICVAPTFWVLMGFGIALNAKAKPLIRQEVADYKESKRKKNENMDNSNN